MRNILTMALKDLTLIRRDWLGMFFIVAFPVLMGLFFGAIMGSFDAESVSLSVAVVDHDQSAMSAAFIEALQDSKNVQLESMNLDEATDRVRRGRLTGLIVLPEGFGETAGIMWAESPAIKLGIDPSRKVEAGMLQGLVMQSMGRLTQKRFQDPESMRPFLQQAKEEIARADDIPPLMRPVLTQMMTSLDALMASIQQVQDESGVTGAGNHTPQMQLAHIEEFDVTREPEPGSQQALVRKLRSPWDITFPQAMLWGILACSAGFAVTLVRERQLGTLTRLQVAPVSRGQILAGKAVACGIAVIGVIVQMIVLGVIVGMRPASPWLLALATLCVAFCFVGIMMMMSVVGKTEEAVGGAAWGLNTLMAMFGGGMIPLAFMPGILQTLSHISPAKWAILSLEGAIWRGFTLPEMLLPCAILLSVGLLTLTAGVWIISREAV